MKGIDPLSLPSYRVYNLLLYMMKEGASEEQISALQASLARFDADLHPLSMLAKSLPQPVRKSTDAPAEQRTEKEYVPSWWRGEDANARVGIQMMTALPK